MASPAAAPKPRPRPLSPHLDVYRMTLTMAMSIIHRITGVGLYIGVALLAWFLIALSGNGSTFATFSTFINSFIGQLLLLGFTWALFHHLLGGLRHALWDAGIGLDHPLREQLAQGTLIGGIGLTVIAWVIGYIVR
jgi:succinate dehydrogenase cytochrome b subunit